MTDADPECHASLTTFEESGVVESLRRHALGLLHIRVSLRQHPPATPAP